MQSCQAARRSLVGLVVVAGALAGGGCGMPDDAQAPPAIAQLPETPLAAAVPTSGLIGEWKLDENSGNQAADTKSGFHAGVFGGAAFIGGHLGNALDLNNGTAGVGNKYAEMPSNTTLNTVQNGSYTISAWFRPYTVPTDDSVANRSWAIVVKAGQHLGLVYSSTGRFSARHYLVGDVAEIAEDATVYPVGSWYHVVGRVDRAAGTVRVYVNGDLQDTETYPANAAAKDYGTVPFKIGKARTNWSANGRVDQVRIYNRALTDGEIDDLFAETVAASPAVTTSPVSAIGWTKATLNGTADPNGSATTGWFRYSKTNPGTCNDTFGTRVPATGGSGVGSGTSPVAYSQQINPLPAGNRYYYCAIASNSAGTAVSSTVQNFMGGGSTLRGGLWGFENLGEGPGGNTGAPIYTWTFLHPQPSTVNSLIALAEQHDVVLLLNLARGKGQWAPGGIYNPGAYEANVREFEGNATLAAAITSRRVLLFVVDEANHDDHQGTISPTEVNEMGLLHKSIWPDALTFVRMSGSTLTESWDIAPNNATHHPLPPNGYTGLDYGWAQRSGQHNDMTLAAYFQEERNLLNSLNMGMVPGLNWWAGGLRAPLEGVPGCWDVDHTGPLTSGFIVGTGEPNKGDILPCTPTPPASVRVIVSPQWMRRWADVVHTDADAPFVSIWRTPSNTEVIPGSEALGARADYVGALDHVLLQGASRSSWAGFRTPKPPPN